MKPEKVFRIGSVSASVFVNEDEQGNRHIRNFNLQKRSRDGDEWKSSTTFGLAELPQAIAVLDLATKYVAEQAAEDSAASGAEPGLLESLGRSLSGAGEALDFNERLDRVQERTAEVVEHLIQLSVVFVLQTGILPIAFLWVFLQLLKQSIRIKN